MGCLENIVQKPVFKMMLLKSPPPCFKTTNNVFLWQLGNYFEHCVGPPGQTYLCSVSSELRCILSLELKNVNIVHVSAFFKSNTYILNTYFCFLNIETCYLKL